MRSFSLGRGLLAAVALQSLALAATPASAQEVVMRRPLPRSFTTTPPPITDPEEIANPIVNPTEVCDNKPGSPVPVLQYAAWIQNPDVDTDTATTPNCKTRTTDFHCEAYYTCSANGENVASGGVVADQICLDHAYPVPEIAS